MTKIVKIRTKIRTKIRFSAPNSRVPILTILAILSLKKIEMTKFHTKKSFFTSDFESEGLILPACKFSARCEVKIDKTSFWRFWKFLSYVLVIPNFGARFRNLRSKLLLTSHFHQLRIRS